MTSKAPIATGERPPSADRPLPGETPELLETWDREVLWHPFTQMDGYEPRIMTRAEGCYLYDREGRGYLDGVSSLWCNVHGHRHPKLDAAARQQLDQVAHVTTLGLSHPATIRLARRLTEVAPDGLDRAFFSGDGAAAVEVALKMAFQYWRQAHPRQPERRLYVTFDDAYHGDTLGSVSVGGVDLFHQMFAPLLFEAVRLPAPNVDRRPPGVSREEAAAYYADQVERCLAEHAGRVAAVVVEPLVQGAAGLRMHPAGFLKRLRACCDRHDVFLVADEVAVGFGRTGTLFACEQEDVSPDFLCLGKGLTGGYLAMSATLTTTRVWKGFLPQEDGNAMTTFFHGHTYAGNPLAAAVALASLDVFEEEQTLAGLPAKIERLGAGLANLSRLPHVGHVRQCGMIGAVELVRDRDSGEPFDPGERRGAAVCRHAFDEGVWLRPLGDVIVIMPPLAVTCEQIDQIMDAVAAGIRRACPSDS